MGDGMSCDGSTERSVRHRDTERNRPSSAKGILTVLQNREETGGQCNTEGRRKEHWWVATHSVKGGSDGAEPSRKQVLWVRNNHRPGVEDSCADARFN